MIPRNAFVKANWNNGALRWNEETNAWEYCHEHLQLAIGPRHIPSEITAEVEGGNLCITCRDSGLGNSHAVPDERLYLAVFLPDVQTLKLYTGPMRDSCARCTFELPEEFCITHAAIYVYVWFQATSFHRADGLRVQVRPDQANLSRYLGTFHC